MTVPVQFQCQSARTQLQHSLSDRKLDKSADCISGLNSVAAALVTVPLLLTKGVNSGALTASIGAQIQDCDGFFSGRVSSFY
ncbi:hypothetical protein WJX82_011634 [Trebouxia sp. C0006]